MKKIKSVLGEHIYNESTLHFQFVVRLVGVLIAIVLMQLSNYTINYIVFGSIATSFIIYCFVVRYSKLKMNLWFQKINLFIDVLIITVLIGIRGGIRSDYYLGYYIILGYVILLRDHKLLFNISLWIIISYAAVTIGYSEHMDYGRLIIRIVLMITTMLCLFNYSRILSHETSLRLKASNLALKDPLTNVYNRNILINIESLISDNKVCMAMLDIDDFKVVNDTYGHVNGDDVLKKLGELFEEHLSTDDIAIRYGGEEFLLIMQEDYDQAKKKIIHIKNEFNNFKYEWMKDSLTFSAGVVEHIKNQTLKDCITEADKNLYTAKTNGKNQVL